MIEYHEHQHEIRICDCSIERALSYMKQPCARLETASLESRDIPFAGDGGTLAAHYFSVQTIDVSFRA